MIDYKTIPYDPLKHVDFVWQLHLKENKSYIDRHIGADMKTIRGWFDNNIAKQDGFILQYNHQWIGCYFIQDFEDCIKLCRLFLIEKMQRQGIGTQIFEHFVNNYGSKGKPLKINVWKDNPVQEYWLNKGFAPGPVDEDGLMLMEYKPASSSV